MGHKRAQVAKSSYTCSKSSSEQAAPALLTAPIQGQVPDKGSGYLGSALILPDSTEQGVPPQCCPFQQFTKKRPAHLMRNSLKELLPPEQHLDHPNLTSPWGYSLFSDTHTVWRSWIPKIHPKPATPAGFSCLPHYQGHSGLSLAEELLQSQSKSSDHTTAAHRGLQLSLTCELPGLEIISAL